MPSFLVKCVLVACGCLILGSLYHNIHRKRQNESSQSQYFRYGEILSVKKKKSDIADLLIQQAKQETELLMPMIDTPSKESPFVFLHQRKGGGSFIRAKIYAALNASLQMQNNTTWWIPCETHACVPYSLPPPLGEFSVYASHVNYVQMLSYFQEEKIAEELIELQHTGPESGANVSFISFQEDDIRTRSFCCLCRSIVLPTYAARLIEWFHVGSIEWLKKEQFII